MNILDIISQEIIIYLLKEKTDLIRYLFSFSVTGRSYQFLLKHPRYFVVWITEKCKHFFSRRNDVYKPSSMLSSWFFCSLRLISCNLYSSEIARRFLKIEAKYRRLILILKYLINSCLGPSNIPFYAVHTFNNETVFLDLLSSGDCIILLLSRWRQYS